jgi:glycosyltransferase involved in cell wall biosynthesis
MKILLVCLGDFRAPPGTRQTLRLAKALTDAGNECLVLIEGDLETLRFVSASERSYELEVDRYGFVGPFLDRRTHARVADFNPDIVHCYEPRTAPLSASLQLSQRHNASLCVRFADDDEHLAREAGGSGIRGQLGRPLMLGLGTVLPRRWPYKHPWLYKRMLARAAGFDAITPALAAAINNRYGVKCRSILPAMPEQEAPRPQQHLRQRLGLPPSGQLVVYTGSVYRPQLPDFELLLRGFCLLAKRNPEVQLVHTGRIAARYEEERLRALTGSGLDRTHFLGFLEDPSDVNALLAEASVLVQPGPPTEFNRLRLPAKVPDYLLAGRPVVTFAAGFGELLEDRVDAVLTRSGEPEELGEALAWVLADPQRAEALGEAGRRCALSLFDPASIASQTLDYYKGSLEADRVRT